MVDTIKQLYEYRGVTYSTLGEAEDARGDVEYAKSCLLSKNLNKSGRYWSILAPKTLKCIAVVNGTYEEAVMFAVTELYEFVNIEDSTYGSIVEQKIININHMKFKDI